MRRGRGQVERVPHGRGPENTPSVQEMKLPRRRSTTSTSEIDDTRTNTAWSSRRSATWADQFADEITQVLTKLSFEIKTEIRFIPNDAGQKRGEGADDDARGAHKLAQAEVTAQVSIKDNRKDTRQKTTTGAPPPNPGRRGREDLAA